MSPERNVLLLVLVLLLAACSTSGSIKKESAATQREDAARINTDLGQQYLRQGKLEMAMEKLQRALSYDPGYADAHTVIAVLYERIGDEAQAEKHYRRAAELQPRNGAALNNYGTFLCKLGRYEEAGKYFQRALADPFYKTPAVALTNAGTCQLNAGQPDAAEASLRLALQRDPQNGEALLQLAQVSYVKGDWFSARGFIQRFEAVAQPRPGALMLGRNIELKLGNAKGVSEYTRKLLRDFPDSAEAQTLNVRIQRDEQAK